MALFDPITIGNVVVPNRIAKSAMVEGRCDERGLASPDMAEMYERWSRGGVGLAFTGMAMVVEGTGMTPCELGLYSDEQIGPLARVAAAVHRHPGKVFVQLCYAPPQVLRKTAIKLGSPSISGGLNCATLTWNRALRDEELLGIAASFGRAARRAREAGVDGVQLHAAHGYLLSRSLSPKHNRRCDAWGGTPERRLKLLSEVFRAIQTEAGRDFPIAVKLNAHDGLSGGLTIEHTVDVARALQRWGCAAIEVSAGTADVGLSFYPNKGEIPIDLGKEFLAREMPLLRPLLGWLDPVLRHEARGVVFAHEAYFLEEAKRIAEAVDIPVITVGGIRSRAMAESILANSRVAMVSLARPLVRQPRLPQLWQDGLQPEASCDSCNRCYVRLGLGEALRCDRRPESEV